MAAFRVPCPSCDNQVLVKDAGLVGKKIECPKCKYRFKVESAPPEATADAAKPAKGKGVKGADAADGSGKKTAKAAKKKGNPKVMIGVGLGVVAVLLLAVGGFLMFGGSDDKKPTPRTNTPRPIDPVAKADPVVPDPDTPKPPPKKDDAAPPPPPPPVSDKDPTNLLPNDSRAVYRFNLDKARQTPPFLNLVDAPIRDLFKASFGLDADLVETYIHAAAGPAKEPFGVVRLKTPQHEAAIVGRMRVAAGPKSPINGKRYHTVRDNPFLAAVGKAVSVDALPVRLPPAAPAKPAADRPLAVCVYDSQTLLVADQEALEAFLAGLQPNGYPAFQTELSDPRAPQPALPPKGAAGAKPGRLFTTNPTYRTLEPQLKDLLNTLEENRTPILVAAAFLDAGDRALDPGAYRPAFRPAAAAAANALTNTAFLGVTLTAFTPEQVGFQAVVGGLTDEAARKIAKEQLAPALTALVVPALSQFLGNRVAFRDGSDTSGVPPAPPGDTGAAPPLTSEGSSGGTPGAVAGLPPELAALPDLKSKLDLTVSDTVVTVTADLRIGKEGYQQQVGPQLVTAGNQFKGRMRVLSGEAGWFAVAAATRPMVDTFQQFPRGTAERPLTDSNRFGLAHPPGSRVSFVHALLPFLGKGSIAQRVDPLLAWNDERNLAGAEAWVPELLVPSYAPAAWRATTPLAEGRTLGATNFVAVAGLGRDAARYSAADPAQAKRMGVVGYDWGSKPADITDGLSNTIYLLQVPPGVGRPWVAGGGATVMGVDDTLPNPAAAFAAPGKDGKPGAYALMADGSVRWVPADVNPKVFLGMATRAGGETLAEIDTAAPKVTPEGGNELKADPAKPPAKPDAAPAPKAAMPK